MNAFDFFAQGNFKKIAAEQGLDTKYLIFQFLICNLSAVSIFILTTITDNRYIRYASILMISVLLGFSIKNKVMNTIKNKRKFLYDLFPLEMPFLESLPSHAPFLNKNMRWLSFMAVFNLLFVYTGMSHIDEVGSILDYFCCYFFGLCLPLSFYMLFLRREYKRMLAAEIPRHHPIK